MADRSGLVCFLHLTRKGVVYRRPTLSIMMKIKRCIITSTRILINNTDGVFNSYGQSPGVWRNTRHLFWAGEATGILLGCKRTGYHGDYISVDCWDMYGNYIDKDTYGKLAEQYYADLQKKQGILWIECQDLEDLSKEEIYNLLKSSMDSFSLADI